MLAMDMVALVIWLHPSIMLQLTGEKSTVNSILQSMAKLSTQTAANPMATLAGTIS